MRQDRKLQWAVQHGLLIAREALFNAGAHILAGEFREATRGSGDSALAEAVELLGQGRPGSVGLREVIWGSRLPASFQGLRRDSGVMPCRRAR
jgi:hypothetical protein